MRRLCSAFDRWLQAALRLGWLAAAAGAFALTGCDIPPAQVSAQVVTPSLWTYVAAGESHSLGIKADGTLWAWGDNTFGQLGDGTNITRLQPVRVGAGSNWAFVAAGSRHSMAVDGAHQLYTWGDNFYGQLGDGTTVNKNVPVHILGNWANGPWTLAAGCGHSLALTSANAGTGWGDNTSGQAGTGVGVVLVPTAWVGGTTYFLVAAGCDHSLAVQDAASGSLGKAVAWGLNNFGQLGDNTTVSQTAPSAIPALPSGVIGIAAGQSHSVAVWVSGGNKLMGWGDNSYGQLGDGTTADRHVPTQEVSTGTLWASVAAGQFHTIATKTDHTAWTWGDNSMLQLTDAVPGTTAFSFAPLQIIPNAGKVLWVAAGRGHSLAQTGLASVFAWGANDFGQLGDNTTQARATPKAIP